MATRGGGYFASQIIWRLMATGGVATDAATVAATLTGSRCAGKV